MSTTLEAPVLPTYARQDVTFVSGEGSWLVADSGERYLDLVAGIAVVGLGHCHPAPLAAAQDAARPALAHVEPVLDGADGRAAERLSDALRRRAGVLLQLGRRGRRGGLKYARKATGRPGIVALEGSFHGRTMGALSATGQPAKRVAFGPLVPGVTFATLNDVESLVAAARPDTGAILLEPVQGEGGVHPATAEFLAAARTLADELGALLVLDEVQTGVGRTGTFFCFEQLDVRPDAVTLAKGLANGLPIGALLVAAEAAGAFVPGDHASTFGGNPVACAAACAVVDELTDDLLAGVRAKEALVREAFPGARGRGLLLALDVDRPAADVVADAFDRGVLVCTAGERTIRLTPPLTITTDELSHGLAVLREVLNA